MEFLVNLREIYCNRENLSYCLSLKFFYMNPEKGSALMKFVKFTFALVCGLTAVSIMAQEASLRFSLGPYFRDFDEVEFKSTSFRNSGNATTGAPFGIQNYTTLTYPDMNPRTVAVDYVRYNGVEDDLDSGDSWGPMIGLEYEYTDNVDYILSFVANFQFYSIQTGSRDPGNFNVTSFGRDANFNPATNSHTVAVASGAGTPGFSQGTTASVENDFDMELYVFDLGVKMALPAFDPFFLSWALGPNLHIADVDVSQKISASWNPEIAPEDTGTFNGVEVGDSDLDIFVGFYTTLEASYRINESLSIAAGVRYDYVPFDAETFQAKLDLDSFGGFAKLVVDF